MNKNKLAEKLSTLSPAQREALLQKLKKQKLEQNGGRSTMAITPVDRSKGGLPLSFSQQRLWFLDKLETNAAFYNIPAAVELKGELDVEALRQALEAIVYRHESLRTAFIEKDDETHQVIQPAGCWVLPMEDLSNLAEEEKVARTQARIQFESAQPFDLSSGTLLRTTLLRLSANNHVLITVMHHIASDGWSSGILLKEVSALYGSFKQGQSVNLPELRIQYADYAAWQRDYLQGKTLQKQLQHWCDRLKNVDVLEMPTDRARPPVQTYNGDRLSFTLDKALLGGLSKLSQASGTTLFMTLMAVYKVLLHRYSNQTDICVGFPIANRTRTDIEPLIGFFVNSLAIRSDLADDPSFNALLSGVEKATIDAYAHQDVPFEQLVDALIDTRDPSHNPLFQVFFSLLNGEVEQDLSLPGLQSRFIPAELAVSKFDLSLNCREYNDRVVAEFEYNTDLFDSETIERMARHFTNLVECVVNNPDLPLSELELLDPAERRQLLRDWNQTQSPIEKICVQQYIEAQVKRTPNATAVVCGDTRLSYQLLNNRANQLARHLRNLGIEKGCRVGICLTPSVEVPIAILATLKAGGAYVPMDPSYPTDRLAHMVNCAEMKALITESDLKSSLPFDNVEIIALEETVQQLQDYGVGNLDCINEPEDLLYIVYTSGSTGMPKGAGVRHDNEINLLSWYSKEYGISGQDKILVISALGFDLTQKNLLAPLINGAQLVFPKSTHYDNRVISETIKRQGITLLNCAPSAFYPLISASNDLSELKSLRCVLFGGEPIKMENLLPWVNRNDFQCKIVNMYGPTECTDIAASYTIENPKATVGKCIPIGRPNDNVQLYILDGSNQPTPIGVSGELCIGGASVGIGYLNNPELTAEKFFDNPFGAGKLYRTGDLARYRNNGLIEFISRIDSQIKVRGFRIELGEIETQLLHHPKIKEAVIAPQEAPNGTTVLVGYHINAQGENPEINDLRTFLRQSLPDYMVPLTFVEVGHIPLTPNGKVNRDALPVPDLQFCAKTEYVAPRNNTEQSLATIWSEVLKLDKVGIHDNFFEIGGHSLLATQLATRIRDAMGIELPLRTFFEVTTVAEIADLVSGLQMINDDNLLASGESEEIEDEEFEEGIL